MEDRVLAQPCLCAGLHGLISQSHSLCEVDTVTTLASLEETDVYRMSLLQVLV